MENVSVLSKNWKERVQVLAKAKKILVEKAKLAATDYKITKCAEYQLVGKELPYDVVVLNRERDAIRDRINILEA